MLAERVISLRCRLFGCLPEPFIVGGDAVFVGVGAGLCFRVGGAPGGDDALAMSVSRCLHIRIAWAYLFFDLIVLALSLSYIPLNRIAYSLLTVALSGQIVGLMQKIPLPDGKRKEKARV